MLRKLFSNLLGSRTATVTPAVGPAHVAVPQVKEQPASVKANSVHPGLPAELYAEKLEQLGTPEQRQAFRLAIELTEAIQQAGGRVFLVGGIVRDELIGKFGADFDLEVYGLSAEKLSELCGRVGIVDEVGKQFGILKVWRDGMAPGDAVDVALPRTDSKVGEGHRGFSVESDPNMLPNEAVRRRDFTVNALLKDPLTGEIFDYVGGLADLQAKQLRMVDREHFGEDPLRLFRAIRFASQLGFEIEPDTASHIVKTAHTLNEVDPERFGKEWQKLLLGSEPAKGLDYGMRLGLFQVAAPELAPLLGTPQEAEFHPEGDVWTHTLLSVEQAALIADREGLGGEEALLVMAATLAHDLGKPETTKLDEHDRLRSFGHEEAGVPLTKSLLSRMQLSQKLISTAASLVAEHMWILNMYRQVEQGQNVTEKAIRRLAQRLKEPANIRLLSYVCQADADGRGPGQEPYQGPIWMRRQAELLAVLDQQPTDLIRGQQLIELGLVPGPAFHAIIDLANQLRDDRGYTDQQVLELIGSPDETRGNEQVIARLRQELPAG